MQAQNNICRQPGSLYVNFVLLAYTSIKSALGQRLYSNIRVLVCIAQNG